MTTNSTEYMREYQKEYRKTHPQKQYKKKKVKLEVKKVKNLIPPRAPAKVDISGDQNIRVEDRVVKMTDSTAESTRAVVNQRPSESQALAIDFSYLTNNSSFQRAIMEFIRKYVPGLETLKVRGNKEVMKQSFNENANNYRNVMIELKEVLKKRNES